MSTSPHRIALSCERVSRFQAFQASLPSKVERERETLAKLSRLADNLTKRLYSALSGLPFSYDKKTREKVFKPLPDETGKAQALSHLRDEVAAAVLSSLSYSVAKGGKWETLCNCQGDAKAFEDNFTREEKREAYKGGNAILARFSKAPRQSWEVIVKSPHTGQSEVVPLPCLLTDDEKALATDGQDEGETLARLIQERGNLILALASRYPSKVESLCAFLNKCQTMEETQWPKDWKRDARAFQAWLGKVLPSLGLAYLIKPLPQREKGRKGLLSV